MIKEPGSRVLRRPTTYIEDSIPYIGAAVFEIVKGREYWEYVFLSSNIPERKIVYFLTVR